MQHPGQPKSPPSWYRDRGHSFIEKKFSAALNDMANLIEREQWFGDSEKHSRYRVDFILKDARLIIELDGHEFHSTREQLEKDAIRQRYLTRAGYSIIKFTGREINRSPAECVREVRNIYHERIQRNPSKYRAFYIDYNFFSQEAIKAMRFYKKMHPDIILQVPTLETFIPQSVDWLHEKSFITAFIFTSPEEKYQISHLNGRILEWKKGEVRMNVIDDVLYSIELGSHLTSYSHLFDDFYLVGDDPVYAAPLRAALHGQVTEAPIQNRNQKNVASGKILRKDNEETSFTDDLGTIPWQDIWYPIGFSMGLARHQI